MEDRLPAGARQTGVLSVLVDHDAHGDERLWVGSDGDGLGLYAHDHWHYFNKAGGQLADDRVEHDRARRRSAGPSRAWLGTGHGQLLRVRDRPGFDTVATPGRTSRGSV